MPLCSALAPLGPSLTTLLDLISPFFLACWVGGHGGCAPVAPQLISRWGYFQTWILIILAPPVYDWQEVNKAARMLAS